MGDPGAGSGGPPRRRHRPSEAGQDAEVAPEVPGEASREVTRKKRETRIYGLLDPITGDIRYIGYTTLSLKQRLAWHLYDDRDNARVAWIQSLTRQGCLPMMVCLEVVRPARTWPERERWWIQHGRSLGWPLTNQSDGGEGPQRYVNDGVHRPRRSRKGLR